MVEPSATGGDAAPTGGIFSLMELPDEMIAEIFLQCSDREKHMLR